MSSNPVEIEYNVGTRHDGMVDIEFSQSEQSVTVTTDRDGVERLIRDLREARDTIDEHDL